ncbi:MAG: hypothetical protein ACRC7N_21675 [Clostridium sp.]
MKKFFMLVLIVASFVLIGCKSSGEPKLSFSGEQKDTIQNIFLSVLKNEVKYTEEVSKVMTKDIYNSINMGNHYTNFTKIEAEILESKYISKDDKILLYLSLDVKVINGTEKISEGLGVPIVLTINKNSTGYIIEEKQEYMSKKDIPNEFK